MVAALGRRSPSLSERVGNDHRIRVGTVLGLHRAQRSGEEMLGGLLARPGVAQDDVLQLGVALEELDRTSEEGIAEGLVDDVGRVVAEHLDHVVGEDVAVDLLEAEEVLLGELGAVALVEALDDLGERQLLLGSVLLGRGLADRPESYPLTGVEGGVAGAGVGDLEGVEAEHVVGDLDLGGDVAVREHLEEPFAVNRKPLQVGIPEPDDLGDEGVEAEERPQELAELLLPAVVERLPADDGGADSGLEVADYVLQITQTARPRLVSTRSPLRRASVRVLCSALHLF